jgi:hypothetical protein
MSELEKLTLKPDPTNWVEWINTKLLYNYKSDTIHWKSMYSDDGLGSVLATNSKSRGYLTVPFRICGKLPYIHQVVWILTRGGNPPSKDIDHIDGNILNNAHWNLRDVSTSANLHNTKAKGYYWCKNNCNWHARIKVNYKQINLGRFNTEEEAHAAYEAAKKVQGFIHR